MDQNDFKCASAHQQVGLFQEKRGLGEGRRYETIP